VRGAAFEDEAAKSDYRGICERSPFVAGSPIYLAGHREAGSTSCRGYKAMSRVLGAGPGIFTFGAVGDYRSVDLADHMSMQDLEESECPSQASRTYTDVAY
jgi:hypothetical protein